MTFVDPHNRPLFKTSRPDLIVQVTDDGSRTLVEVESGNGFHSAAGARTETDHVYISNSGVRLRLESGQSTRVLEVGLGTSLAMLMTVDLAMQHGTPLEYHALEIDWLPADVLEQLDLAAGLTNRQLVDEYLEFRRASQNQGGSSCSWQPVSGIEVTIHLQDAIAWSHQKHPEAERRFNAIFFDPFAPSAAPALWTTPLFKAMAGMMDEDGLLVTYSCSRCVRDSMAAAGLLASVVPGPPRGKRNSLVAKHRKGTR